MLPPMRPLFFLLCLAAPLRAQDTAVLDAWLGKQSTIRSLSVPFTQTRTLPSLKQPVTTPGKLVFEKPGKLRWELCDPPATLAVSDGTTFTLVDVKKQAARRIAADSPQAARFSLLATDAFKDAAAFRTTFRVADQRVTNGLHQFTLQPLDAKLRSQVPWVFLTIDPATLHLRAFEIEAKDKSRIRTEFGKPIFNQPIPEATFRPDLTGYRVRS